MARIIPSTVKNFHGTQGEQKVFFALWGLPDDIVIIHSFRWLHPGYHRNVSARVGVQGEGDFVIFDPAQGIMVIEVKGGEIWCERGEWRQRNRATCARLPGLVRSALATRKLATAAVRLWCQGQA